MLKLITFLGLVSACLTAHAGSLAFGTEKNNYDRNFKISSIVITRNADETMLAIYSKKGSCLVFQKEAQLT